MCLQGNQIGAEGATSDTYQRHWEQHVAQSSGNMNGMRVVDSGTDTHEAHSTDLTAGGAEKNEIAGSTDLTAGGAEKNEIAGSK